MYAVSPYAHFPCIVRQLFIVLSLSFSFIVLSERIYPTSFCSFDSFIKL